MLPIYCRGVVCILTLCLSLITTHSTAQPWQPWGQITTPHQHSTDPESLHPLKQGVRFFQRYISVVDSPRCPMYPTCSAYAIQALDKHGAVLGSFITVDRLLHESTPLEQKHPLTGYERLRFYDPLSANDFWLAPAATD
ncbi:MAG: hypothetical protein B6I37_05215 [Desulfobacteraceae bacterium 4572_35.2]|nr:MAG: hypothetical protein B6I37_05215 [Desulfobacteraceae bacterium 4572_35.2]